MLTELTTNIETWHAKGRRHAEIEQAVSEFVAGLRAELGASIAPGEDALIQAAGAILSAILLAKQRLLKGRSRHANLFEQIATLSGSLTRVLRALSRDGAPLDRTLPPAGLNAEEQAAWAKTYVSGVYADAARRTSDKPDEGSGDAGA